MIQMALAVVRSYKPKVEYSRTMNRIAGLGLPQLKAELKNRGAKVSGRKAELVDRLHNYCFSIDFL